MTNAHKVGLQALSYRHKSTFSHDACFPTELHRQPNQMRTLFEDTQIRNGIGFQLYKVYIKPSSNIRPGVWFVESATEVM